MKSDISEESNSSDSSIEADLNGEVETDDQIWKKIEANN